jgi:solute carrier family 25 (adenine nucleotide translocator) protein 4/5/6/31
LNTSVSGAPVDTGRHNARAFSWSGFLWDFAAAGVSSAVAKTATAPVSRVKLIIQTQDTNPLVRRGEVPRYTGIVNCFSRLYREQGLKALWRGNFADVSRYIPAQAFTFSFKDTTKYLLPKYNPKEQYVKSLLVNVTSGALAGAGSLCLTYPLDYAELGWPPTLASRVKRLKG